MWCVVGTSAQALRCMKDCSIWIASPLIPTIACESVLFVADLLPALSKPARYSLPASGQRRIYTSLTLWLTVAPAAKRAIHIVIRGILWGSLEDKVPGTLVTRTMFTPFENTPDRAMTCTCNLGP